MPDLVAELAGTLGEADVCAPARDPAPPSCPVELFNPGKLLPASTMN